jgi:hypothetical protein
MHQVHPAAMKLQIAFLGSAAAGSRFSGKVIVPGFRFSAAGLAFEQWCYETLIAVFP